ncbi:MAG: ACP S-malonyltransferase [Solirubrobacterales bacterium]|nr:ACP S-malonyltransferase [Solirubrobacterales bacterium]
MTETVVLFPGQGSQPRDMREHVGGPAPELVTYLEEECGPDVFDRTEQEAACRQPAFVASTLAGWARLQALVEQGTVEWGDGAAGPMAVAGHSLGEIPALVAGGVLDARDAIRLAHLRGSLYDEAQAAGPPGDMLALVGDGAHDFAHGLDDDDLWIANDNSPVQVVLSGAADAVERVRKEAKAAGLRAVPLVVGVPAHTPMLAAYRDRLRAALDDVPVHEPRIPVWSCTTAAPMGDVREEVADCIVQPVHWRQLLLALHERGARRFIDTGPGHVVAGLAHKTLPGVETPTSTDLEEAHG